MLGLTYTSGSGSSSYTVPDGRVVLAFVFISSAGGTLTISPGGAGNAAPVTAGPSIPLLAGIGFGRDYRASGPQELPFPMLGAGTVFTYANVDSFYIEMGG